MIELNEEQKLPAETLEGAVLVTAGAGSGKTRLLTQRIANLVAAGVSPYHILCITFTNKAAGEMRSRLEDLVDTTRMWIMTFHGMCLKLLRYYGERLEGYTRNFVVYAEAEKEHVLKRLITDRNLETDKYFKKLRFLISDSKNDVQSIADYVRDRGEDDKTEELMNAYRDELRRCDAMDFDDLLLNCYLLLSSCPDVLEQVQDRFRYISVDEFQDTNRLQYEIVRLLGKKYGNVFVVGDEDQSIYGWRGANIENIFDFKKDFNAKVFKLERNYRSTGNILAAANAIISHNTSRLVKNLWTDKGAGARIERYVGRDETDEAEYVVRGIDSLVRYNGYKYSDIAILMRLNALTRPFEERLLSYNIGYAVYGGFKFYDRKEIKDILAYLRLAANPRDEEAVIRTINTPKRGIGDGAVAQLRNYCAVSGRYLNDVCRTIRENSELPAALVKKVAPFGDLVRRIADASETLSLAGIADFVIEESGYRNLLNAEDTEENRSKLANLNELIAAIADYEEKNPDGTLSSYLESVALMSDLDSMDDERNLVTLATVHSAKGLEFKVVFVVGLDEGVFPVRKESTAETEEERRLMYVAITRAKERLYLTRASSRYLYGRREYMAPSRFLGEDGSVQKVDPNASVVSSKPDPHRLSVQAPSAAPQRPAVDVSKYVPGTVVLHKVFGRGVVTAVIPLKDITVVTVRFDSVGNKNLGLGLVPLEIVE